jgi:hypothetical protein
VGPDTHEMAMAVNAEVFPSTTRSLQSLAEIILHD